MAADKRKILEAARKHAQKGAKDKALKEFGKLLKLDPRDSKVRLEVGDTHRRWGQVKEAIDAYSAVAEQFMNEGFDARAVAVFKQIQNLQPDTFAYHEPLAELYQRMGLAAEAISSLEAAAESYRNAGQKQEALGLLRKMAAIDPTNTTSRIKVADLLQQEGMKQEAIAEYDAVVTELEMQGDSEAAAKLFERILEIEPDRVATVVLYARNLLGSGALQRAEMLAKRALELDRSPEHYELLADVYRQGHRDDELVALYRELADLYRERGDEERTREILQRYVPLDGLGTADVPNGYINEDEQLEAEKDRNELSIGDETTLLDGDLLSDTSLLVSDDDSGLGILRHDDDLDDLGADDIDLISDSNEMTCLLPDESQPAAASRPSRDREPDVDVNQLLAEASVYLRYGKRSQAVANLESILEQDPDHRLALEKLGEALVEGDDKPRAVEMWSRAARLAVTSGESEAAEVLRSRIAVLDAAAAQALDLSAPAAPMPDSDEDVLTTSRIDDSIDELSIPGGATAGSSASDADDLEGEDLPELDLAEVSIHGMDLEIDIDDASFTQPPPDVQPPKQRDTEARAADSTPDTRVDTDEISIDDLMQLDGAAEESEVAVERFDSDDLESEEIEIDADDFETDAAESDEIDVDVEGIEHEAPVADRSAAAPPSPERISEELEEADFYLEQGLLDEAEAVYTKVVSLVPNHPHAMLRLGEIATRRGDESAAAAPTSAPPQPIADPEESLPEQFDESEIGMDLADWHEEFHEDDAAEVAPSEQEIDLPSEAADEIGETDATDQDVAASDLVADSDRAEDSIAGEDLVAAQSDLASDLGLDDAADLGIGAQVAGVAAASTEDDEATGTESRAMAEITQPADLEPLEASESPLVASGTPEGGDSGLTAPADDFGFDLAAELSQSFEHDPGASGSGLAGSSGHGNTSEDGFASVFAEFKKGVSATLTEKDYQAHYDLGIAYREMGLLSDAITELRLAMSDPERRVGCLHLMGICANEMGEPEQAIGHLTAALDSEGISGETVLAVKLDLGAAHESVGDITAARRVYEEVYEVDPHFADVVARLDDLAKPEEVESDDDDGPATEEYESFAEFAGGLDEPEAAAADPAEESAASDAPVWESFDDVVAEAIAEDETDATSSGADAPAPAVPAAPAKDSKSDGSTPAPDNTPKRRKKKISFV